MNQSITKINILQQAKQVLSDEAASLQLLSDKLDQNFEQAVELILAAKGRVIIIGIGKSGHIGAKMAATFASTGTPSFFTHPAELMHGDLGMITAEDLCILISNSGETSEVIDIIPHLNRRQIPIIAITARGESTLAKLSTVALNTHVSQEAGFLNLAPTTSTTVTLALGDALAMVAMEAKNFSREDFAEFHPGGSLGKSLIRVSDLMNADLSTIPQILPSASFEDLIHEINDKALGFCCVTDTNGQFLNILTDGDLRRLQLAYREQLISMTVSSLITEKPTPITIQADMLGFSALEIMQQKKISALIITEGNLIKGVVTLQNLLSAGIV